MVKKSVLFFVAALALCFAACNNDEPSSESGTINYPEGALKGIFSVGPNTKVYFSQGNLQGIVRAYPMEPKWYFATNQWDTIGSRMSVRYEFYSWNTISQYSSFADWKNNSIENGGKGKTTWRLLSADEWEYLFRTRPNAEKLFALGKVEGTNGVILLPDNWDNSIKHVNLATENNMEWDEFLWDYRDNTSSYTYNSNPDYSTADSWKELADLGAVFLPAAGYEYGGKKYHINEDGCYLTPSLYYWESENEPIPDAEVFVFGIGGYETMFFYPRSVDWVGLTGGASLRLVTDVK